MASDDLICGTPGTVCNIDEYPACPQADFSSVFDAWGQPALSPTGITTEYGGGELARAQLDSYVLHSLDDGEHICYREADGYGLREWFVQSGVQGFASSAMSLPFFESADKDEGPTAEVAAEGETSETKDTNLFETGLLFAAGIIVLYTIGKSIIDAAVEGQQFEASRSEDGGEQNAEKDPAPFVAKTTHEAVALELEKDPWKAEKWFDGLSDLASFEVNEILRERVPQMLGDPAFRADFFREGKITAEGVRLILAERGINYTSIGSIKVTRAMEAEAADNKVTPITAGKKGSKSSKKGGFGLFELFKRAGK